MANLFNKIYAVCFTVSGSFIFSTASAQSLIDSRNFVQLNSIAEINKNSSDTCRIVCFVISIYTCPVCPKGVICKPCIGNHIMVGDSINAVKLFRVFVPDPSKFEAGKKYNLLIRLQKYNSEKDVYEARLIGAG